MIPDIAGAARLIASRQLSPVELTRDCLDRIRRLDPALNAFLLVTEDRALADARAAEDRMMRGALRGPLDGIPIAHKDIFETAGIRTTAHSARLRDNVPDTDATAVHRLAAAGTVLLGKLATHEFAFGGPSFDLPWPPARNPWDPARVTGGSSSGTGAAVAAGLVLGGTGSDTVGSIRLPAAYCGIVGLKPTYGRVSRAGVLPLAPTLDHAGPMAWTVEDCALLLQAIAGPDPRDPTSADRPVPDFRAGLYDGAKGLRVGVPRDFAGPLSPATARGLDAAEAAFRDAGAEIRDVRLSPALDYHACAFVIMLAEGYAIHAPALRAQFMQHGAMFRDRIVLGALIGAAEYLQAQRRRRELCAEMAAAMRDVDVLLTATQAGEAPLFAKVLKWGSLEKPILPAPFNVTGHPAISVPAGFGETGLPTAVQLAGRPFEEATLLRAARVIEGMRPRPDLSRSGRGPKANP